MNRYGSDKPDIRFGMELKDLSDLLSQCEFKVFSETIKNGGKVKAINAASCGASLSRKDIDGLSEFVKTYKAKGLAWINYTSEGIKSPILKFIKEEEIKSITERMGAKIGDIIVLVADNEKVVHDSLGQLRLELAKRFNLIDEDKLGFLWVTEFPLLEYDEEEKRYVAKHHPFTSPMDEDIYLLDTNPLEARAKAYDIVLNGYELGGGSIRIHDSTIQEKCSSFRLFKRRCMGKVWIFLEAFKYGTPPHGEISYWNRQTNNVTDWNR